MTYLKVCSSRISLHGSADRNITVSLGLDEIECSPSDDYEAIELGIENGYYDSDYDTMDVNVDGWYVRDVVEKDVHAKLAEKHRELVQDLRKMTNIKQVQKRLKQVKI